MKHFSYRLLIEDEGTAPKARKWCREEFGNIPIIEKNFRSRKKKRDVCVGPVYDKENASWYNKVTGNANHKAFYLKNY